MNLDYAVGKLDTPEDWGGLAQELGGKDQRLVLSIIRHLITVGAKSYLIETRYIDRDYSADYRRFYAQTFRNYERHCKRIHFFKEDVANILALPTWSDRVADLQKTSKRSYIGFCVVRPLPSAPIGRTALLQAGPQGPGLESIVTCRADVRANLLGAELDVSAACFMQQDSRVGACAQVAIWMGARHMHQRHKYNWLSVADITRMAAPTTAYQATSLPAGSEFLTPDHMIRAIHEMGFQPLYIEGAGKRPGKEIAAEILPYVESGLPVILGLVHGDGLGHAVTVIGRVFATKKTPSNQLADYVPAFIVHDDQAGPYMLLPRTRDTAATHNFDSNQLIRHSFTTTTPVDLNVEDHGFFAVVLMPMRVFATARAAERTAVGRLNAAIKNIESIRAKLAEQGAPVNDRLLDELIDAHKKRQVVLRTYLTSASGYRKHITHGSACDDLKDELARMHLPHFTWITEISTVGSYNQASPGMRRMYGHTILDATSTGRDNAGLLALHLPGVLIRRDVNTGEEFATHIKDDTLYHCREKKGP
jgi:hypothetical protein